MSTAIEHGELRFLNLRTRLPFRYGIATMTQMPQAVVSLRVTADGKLNSGCSADVLPPRWFTKDPRQDIAQELQGMVGSIQAALSHAIGLRAANPFAVWAELHTRQQAWARKNSIPPLLAQFGTSMVERALIDAFCRNRMAPFHKLLHKNFLGIHLGQIHPELEGSAPADYLRADPVASITVRHTIGLGDYLTETEIPKGKRVRDGLPETLETAIASYRLRHFKIKIEGKPETDFPRLERIAALLAAHCGSDYGFTLDGNEQFVSAAQFRAYWSELAARAPLRALLGRLLFVEQPIHRDAALAPEVGETFRSWPDRPPMLIDESDATLDSTRVALDLGYDGTTHKNCKGVFKGIANRCLLRKRQRAAPPRNLHLSGEDLCTVGPLSLQPDLAVMAALGIESVERNGHHYCAGLSLFPQAIQEAALAHHPDLYRPSPSRWPTLRIEDGRISTATILQAPFGVGFVPDLRGFEPLAKWHPPVQTP